MNKLPIHFICLFTEGNKEIVKWPAFPDQYFILITQGNHCKCNSISKRGQCIDDWGKDQLNQPGMAKHSLSKCNVWKFHVFMSICGKHAWSLRVWSPESQDLTAPQQKWHWRFALYFAHTCILVKHPQLNFIPMSNVTVSQTLLGLKSQQIQDNNLLYWLLFMIDYCSFPDSYWLA